MDKYTGFIIVFALVAAMTLVTIKEIKDGNIEPVKKEDIKKGKIFKSDY